ncbi:hypothetical protein L1D14_07435 [Vibrio tubiashii]|uniref:hypothetical protein n=1 Tax=Vibrio tubiashii TaxID=29498 RepID=UPI001EFD4F93|nr:hypothetical protein [Vibrio tubiashii]MCG9576070.1 hypothetical protein [Vibrio tubiashii]
MTQAMTQDATAIVNSINNGGYQLLTFEEVQHFTRSNYKHDRLYGRNAATGWHDDYGDNIVKGYLEQLNNLNDLKPFLIISRHESASGEAIWADRATILKHWYQTKSKSELASERVLLNNVLVGLNPDLEKLRKSSHLNLLFAALNVRRNIIKQTLSFTDREDRHSEIVNA